MNNPAIKRQENNPLKERTLEQLRQLLGGDPKTILENLHINQGLSMNDIAHRFHKVPSTVSTWFKWLGIPTNHYISGKTNRMRSAHQLGKLLGGDPKKVLEDLYIKQGLSKKDIAHRFHKNTATVGNWFKKLRISAKTNKEIGLEQLKNLLGGDPKGCHPELCVKICSKQGGKETRAEQKT